MMMLKWISLDVKKIYIYSIYLIKKINTRYIYVVWFIFYANFRILMFFFLQNLKWKNYVLSFLFFTLILHDLLQFRFILKKITTQLRVIWFKQQRQGRWYEIIARQMMCNLRSRLYLAKRKCSNTKVN